jgi:hypothetical protein
MTAAARWSVAVGAQMERVAAFGSGELTVLDYVLDALEPGHRAGMEWMRFRACATWPGAGT